MAGDTAATAVAPAMGDGAGCRAAVVPAAVAGVLVLASALASEAAARWEVAPSVGLRETWTDNVDLEPEGESAFLTELQPAVRVKGQGQRVSGNLDYQLRAIIQHGGDTGDEAFHNLGADAEAEVVQGNLFLNASARGSQAADNILQPVGVDPATGRDNVSQVFSVSAGPRLVSQLGTTAESEFTYRYDRVFSEAENADETVHRGTASLRSGPRFQDLRWSLDATQERIDGENALNDARITEYTATAGYQVTRTLELSATGGFEDNDIETTEADSSGAVWEVSGRWTPNQRVELNGRFGERFFGYTAGAGLSYRHRRVSLSGRYDTQLEDNRATAFGPAETGATAETVNEFLVARRASLNAAWEGRVLGVGASAFRVRREFQASDVEDLEYGGTLTLSASLGQRTNAEVSGRYGRLSFEADDRTDDRWSALAAVTRQLPGQATVRLEYRAQARNSSDPASEYRENAVTAALRVAF